MKGYNGFIVKVEKHIEDEIKLTSGVKLYIPKEYNSVDKAIMEGEIVGLPFNIETKANIGDKLFFSDTITSQQNVGKKSRFCLSEKDKLYFVPYSEENKSNVFAFKQDGEWHLIGRYNLLKPIKFEHLEEKGDLLLITDKRKSYHGFKENIGIIEYPLPDSPFIKGEKVLIDKNYEYKVDLEGVSYYAVATQNICGWL